MVSNEPPKPEQYISPGKIPYRNLPKKLCPFLVLFAFSKGWILVAITALRSFPLPSSPCRSMGMDRSSVAGSFSWKTRCCGKLALNLDQKVPSASSHIFTWTSLKPASNGWPSVFLKISFIQLLIFSTGHGNGVSTLRNKTGTSNMVISTISVRPNL